MTIELNAAMGPAVLEHLRQFTPLPETGVIAGQSVSSAIDDLFGKGGGVYNDVDLFLQSPRSKLRRALENATATQLVPGIHDPAEVERDDAYGGLSAVMAAMQSYTVTATAREGMLNRVYCLPYRNYFTGEIKPLPAERIISSFDLNCVRVAVDLDTQQLVWTPDYERFIHSRQLEITCLQTPFHSFLRLLKKLKEMPGTYADIDAAATATAALYHSPAFSRLRQDHYIVACFGDKLHQLAQELQSTWSPYFRMEDTALKNGAGQLHTMHPKGSVDETTQAAVSRLGPSMIHYAAQTVYRLRRRHPARLTRRLEEIAAMEPAGYVQNHALLRGENYVVGQFSPTHVETVNRYVGQHTDLALPLSGLTLDQQYRMVRELQAVERDTGRGSLALIRGFQLPSELNPAQFRVAAEAKLAAMQKPFAITPLKLPELPAEWVAKGFKVEELTTAGMLEEEGEGMHHCVAGYAASVAGGGARILAIRTGLNRRNSASTVELLVPRSANHRKWRYGLPGIVLHVVQHRGFANSEVSELHQEVLRYVLANIKVSPMDRLYCSQLKLIGRLREKRQHLIWGWWRIKNQIRNWHMKRKNQRAGLNHDDPYAFDMVPLRNVPRGAVLDDPIPF